MENCNRDYPEISPASEHAPIPGEFFSGGNPPQEFFPNPAEFAPETAPSPIKKTRKGLYSILLASVFAVGTGTIAFSGSKDAEASPTDLSEPVSSVNIDQTEAFSPSSTLLYLKEQNL